MTLREKILKLESEIEELKSKIRLLEARPMIITVPIQPAPMQPVQPWIPTQPYYGDPPYTVTCGQTSQNTMAHSIFVN